jgi:hypothetical protein
MSGVPTAGKAYPLILSLSKDERVMLPEYHRPT